MRSLSGKMGPLALFTITAVLAMCVSYVAVDQGVLEQGSPEAGVQAGDAYEHWSADPRIYGPADVPDDYYGPLPDRDYDLDIEGGLTMYPNRSVWWVGNDYRTPGTLVETNRYGLRDDPFPVEPRPGELRIVALGDSNTFGEGLNRSETWPQQLEADLSADMDRPVQVINGGVKGFSTREMYLQLREVMLRFDPDLVIMTVTIGDDLTEQGYEQVAERVERRHPNMSKRERQDELRDALKRYSRGFGERWDQNESTIRTYLRRTEQLLEQEDVPWAIYQFWGESRALPLRLGRFSEEHGVPLIRPHPKLRRFTQQYTILPQDGHLNAEGNRLYAQQVREGLREEYDLQELAQE